MDSQGTLQGLSWLVDEIEASLQDASTELETFLAEPDSDEPIVRCLDRLHEVNGALQMADCHGPLLLAAEMEQVAGHMADRQLMSLTDAGAVLMQAMITLPGYLRQLLTSRRDQPETLLLLLNELRAIKGESLVSESAYFTPRMEAGRQLSRNYNRQPDQWPWPTCCASSGRCTNMPCWVWSRARKPKKTSATWTKSSPVCVS